MPVTKKHMFQVPSHATNTRNRATEESQKDFTFIANQTPSSVRQYM